MIRVTQAEYNRILFINIDDISYVCDDNGTNIILKPAYNGAGYAVVESKEDVVMKINAARRARNLR